MQNQWLLCNNYCVYTTKGTNMAFAAKSTICDKCIAVAFSKDELPIGEHIKHVEISDNYANELLDMGSKMLFMSLPDSPAFQRESDLIVLKHIVSMIPVGGTIVELGSALGGSAHYILNVAPHIGTIACFDPDWKPDVNRNITEDWHSNMKDVFNINAATSYEYAKQLLQPYPQAKLYPLASPKECKWWSTPIDMVFEDATHDAELLRANIEFWYPFVKKGGILAGHDYDMVSVSTEMNKIAKELNLKLEYASAIWWMIKT